MTDPGQCLLVGVSAFLMGFVAAIPVGATQLEIARRSLNGFPSSALMVVAGSVTSDALYGVIAFFGIAPFLRDPTVMAVFWGVNAVLLIGLGIWVIRSNRDVLVAGARAHRLLRQHDVALMTGFSLAVTNPLMIFWWLLAVRLLRDAGMITDFSLPDTWLVIGAGALGIGAYLSLLAFLVYRAKKFVSERGIHRITVVFGILLLCLSIYFIVRAAFVLLGVDAA